MQRKGRRKNNNYYLKIFQVCFLHSETILQGLSDGDRVNGDGELVDDNNDGQDDGDGDASEGQEPSLNGSVRALDGNILHRSGNHERSEGFLGGVLEASAISSLAVGVVLVEGSSDSEESQEGDDQRDEDQSGNGEKGNAENVHSEHEQQLVADGAGEADNQEDGEDTGNNQSDQDESLHELEGGPDRGGRIMGSEGVGLNSSGGLDTASDSLERPVDLGGVDSGLLDSSGGGGGSSGGGLELLRESVPIDDG